MKPVLRFISIMGILSVITGNCNDTIGVITVFATIGWLFWPNEQKISQEDNL
jgi:hypothetical protein